MKVKKIKRTQEEVIKLPENMLEYIDQMLATRSNFVQMNGLNAIIAGRSDRSICDRKGRNHPEVELELVLKQEQL